MIREKKAYTVIEKFGRFLKFRVLHMNDTPHRIAMGVAIGLFVAWTPVLGLHILMVLGLALLLRANKFVAVVFIWVNNPLTMAAIYYPSYLLGRTILQLFRHNTASSNVQAMEILNKFSASASFLGIFHRQFWQNLFELLLNNGKELWLGTTLIGLTAAIAGYFATYQLICWHRRIYPHRRFSENL